MSTRQLHPTSNGTGRSRSTPRTLTWPDIHARLMEAPSGRLYGINRGGAIAAGITGRAVDHIEEADVIVTDVTDVHQPRFHVTPSGSRPIWPVAVKVSKDEVVRFPWDLPPSASEAEAAVARLLEHVGEDPRREGLRATPGRVARALSELTEGYRVDPASILGTVFEENYEGLVLVREIPFWSLCEHHLLPFRGTATVAYLPRSGRIVGLSKVSRLVQCYARRLQVQERMTREIAHALQDHLNPLGVGVVVHGEHTCMSMRGIRTPATMVTSCLLGTLESGEARKEFLAAAGPARSER